LFQIAAALTINCLWLLEFGSTQMKHTHMINGKRPELIKALQKRYGYDRVKAEAELNTLFKEPQHA
jgi:hypothetical protein